MISFVDLPKFFRIVRVETGDEGIVRTSLGRVSKTTLEIDPPLSENLNGDEREEVDHIIAGYREAEVVKRRSYAMNLPIMLRETLEFMETDATEIEKSFIVTALMEALRRMRRFQRES